MPTWTPGDYVLFGIAALVAVTTLLKLVAARRAVLLKQLSRDIAREQKTPREKNA